MANVQKIIQEQNLAKVAMLATITSELTLKVSRLEATYNTMFQCFLISPDSEDIENMEHNKFQTQCAKYTLDLVRKELASVKKDLESEKNDN